MFQTTNQILSKEFFHKKISSPRIRFSERGHNNPRYKPSNLYTTICAMMTCGMIYVGHPTWMMKRKPCHRGSGPEFFKHIPISLDKAYRWLHHAKSTY